LVGVIDRAFLPHRVSFFLAVAVSLGGIFWGTIEAKKIVVERLEFASPKIPPGAGEIKIVQISDLHLGLIEREGRVRQVVDLIRKENPHLIVSTGDLVDGQMYDISSLASEFALLSPPLGKFAVMGNHEFYAGWKNSLSFLERAGFRVLRNESAAVGEFLRIVGVDDPVGARMGVSAGKKESDLLFGKPHTMYTILLKHRPDVAKQLVGTFDLQLSGHTHKGQIFPFRYLTKLSHPFDSGLYPLGLGSFLYVSRGTGTWGPPVRLFAPPEVTVITLRFGAKERGSTRVE
ncbi:MAG: metallophosphoesterase, partial [Deltaproteobacteria bacterium]